MRKIPEWFNIDNYKAVDAFTDAQWLAALSVRYSYFFLSCALKHFKECQDEKNIEIINEDLNYIFREVTSVKPLNARAQLIFDLGVQDNSCIYSLSTMDVFDCLVFLKKEMNIKYTGIVQAIEKDLDPIFNILINDYALNNKTSIDNLAYVKIDLELPDEKIINDFSMWLENTRKSQGNVPSKTEEISFTTSEFEKWTNEQVLPYLDLSIWEKHTGARLTKSTIGKALFPGKFFNEADKISKSTEVTARMLMKGSVMRVFFKHVSITQLMSNLLISPHKKSIITPRDVLMNLSPMLDQVFIKKTTKKALST